MFIYLCIFKTAAETILALCVLDLYLSEAFWLQARLCSAAGKVMLYCGTTFLLEY